MPPWSVAYAQASAAGGAPDVDSRPGNGEGATPAEDDEAAVRIDGCGEGTSAAPVSDALGRPVTRVALDGGPGLHRREIPTDDLPAGTYPLTVVVARQSTATFATGR